MSALATRLPTAEPMPAAFRGGTPLAADVRTRLEAGFGTSLEGVRVHAGAQAERLAQAQGARAFAYGAHVVLGPGESPHDLALMAHEVAHVLQQRGTSPGVQRCAEGGCCATCSASSGHEAEAAQAAAAITSGQSFTVTGRLAHATPQHAGEDEGIVSSLLWRTADAVAPSVVPMLRRGPDGVLDWIKDKVGSALHTVVEAAMAPLRTVANTETFLHAHISPLLASVQEAAARIAQNDCKPITDAAARIEALAERLITPVIEKIQGLVGRVGDFLTGLWDRLGTPVWDFLKKYAGARWADLQQLLAWIWDLVKPVRALGAKAWTWLKNRLGIGEGPEGQDGLLQWLQAKTSQAWNWVQARVEPYKKQIQATLLTLAGVAALFSPAGPFLLAGAALYGAVQGVKWLRTNLAGGQALVRARAYAQAVLIPQMLGAIQRMTAAVRRMAASVDDRLGNLAAALGRLVGAAASSALQFLVEAAQWVADKAQALAAWAGDKLTALADGIARAFNRLVEFLGPLMDFLGMVGALAVDVMALPTLLAGALWKKIPACIRDPFVDWIIPLVLRQVDLFRELAKDEQAWAKTKAGVLRLVRNVFVSKDLQGAMRAAFDLLLQVFNVPLELLEQIRQKAVSAWDTVSKRPIAFIKNAVKALGRGLRRYADKLRDNLLEGLEGWLFSALADSGIAKPKRWSDPWDLVKFGLDVLGISMPHIFELLERRFEKTTVDRLRMAWRLLSGAWDWIMDMKDKKPAEVSREVINAGKEFGKSVMEGIVGWIVERVALELSTMATAAAASAGLSEVLDAVRRIYRAIKTAVRWARTIADMVNNALDAVLDIATGALERPAEILNAAMKKATPAVIGFLGDQVGLGGLADAIKGLVTKLRGKVDGAILAVIDAAKALFTSLVAGAKALAGKVLEWWKQKIRFKAGDKNLTLIVDGTEVQPELLIAASPARKWSDYVQKLPQEARAKGEFKRAMELAEKIEAHRKPIYETDPVRRAKAEDDAAKVMRAHANELAELVKLLNEEGQADLPASAVHFSDMDDQSGGTGVQATILSRIHPEGSKPDDNPPIWANLQDLGSGIGTEVRKRWYVQGHLLNHNLGGPGRRFNMTPITKQANNDHKNFVEQDLKAHVAAGEVLHYTVTVMDKWGENAVPRLPVLKDMERKGTAKPSEIREISALKALGKLTQGFICEVYQLKKVKGQWIKDPKGYNPSTVKISNRITGPGDMPYGYS